jgi:hypothetical protein
MVILNNLNNCVDHLNYYKLYTDNNIKLNEIIQNIIKTYNFVFNPKKYYRHEMNITALIMYELSGITIMLNAILEKTLFAYCIKTCKKYACEKMYCSNDEKTKYQFYTYHFNCLGDKFIIMFRRHFFSPVLIFYPKTNSVYNISYRHSNISNEINIMKNSINYNIAYYPKQNYTSYIIGINNNAGHYYWQEIHGLMLLLEYDLLDYIDEFIIYKYDYLNIADILKNKYNKTIKYLTSNLDPHNLTTSIGKVYITNSSTSLFTKVYNLTNNIENIKSNEINIMFDIRSNSRVWLNQIHIIVNIMNGIKNKFYNYSVNFYISGFYTYDKNIKSSIYNETNEINTQNKIFNIIQSKVKFHIFNLINEKLYTIIKICQKVNLCIANMGSGVSFYYATVFNKPAIGFTCVKHSDEFNKNRHGFQNKINKILCLSPSYIKDIGDNFILKPNILFNFTMNKINNIISQKTL